MFAQIIPLRRMPPNLPWLDYIIPNKLKDKITPGLLVKIPLRNNYEFGIVHSVLKVTSANISKLKSIEEVVIERPLLNLAQLNFLQDLSEIYATPLGFLMKSNLLPLKKRKIEKLRIIKNEDTTPDQIESKKPTLKIYQNQEDKKEFISEHLPSGEQCLFLVPEIHEVDAILSLFTPEQRARTIVVTSETTEKIFFDLWLKIWTNKDMIIVGTRRAFLLPFFNLKKIIVDDESSYAHKSWDMAPRLHARDAALVLAHHHGARLWFLTHTPSVETYYFASKGVYLLNAQSTESMSLNGKGPAFFSTRHEGINNKIPTTYLINLANERRGGNYRILSDEVMTAVQKNSRGITFLYLNRRGNIHYIACRDCANILACPRCSLSLTYYENQEQLNCRHCGYVEAFRMTCKKCGGASNLMYGAGTQQLHKEIKKNTSSNRNIIRIDSDDFKITSEIDTPGTIIIGTQLAWGRITWKKITTMVFVDTDSPLFIPEYKTAEDLWYRLRDARFRLSLEASYFIQTNHPDHIIFQSLISLEKFYTHELKYRKLFGYPPFNYLIKFFAGFSDRDIAKNEAGRWHEKLAQLTKNNSEVTISTPAPSFPTFTKGKFYYVILAKVSYRQYKKWTKLLVSRLPAGWKVDPNPNSILGV